MAKKTLVEQFSDLIREKMTDKEFWAWASTWLDAEDVCDQAEEWFLQYLIKEQKEEIKNAKSFIN